MKTTLDWLHSFFFKGCKQLSAFMFVFFRYKQLYGVNISVDEEITKSTDTRQHSVSIFFLLLNIVCIK